MTILQRFVLGGLCLCTNACWAQGGLFDDLTSPFGQPPAAAKASDEPEVEVDPLTQQLLEHAYRGDRQLADAIASLARTGRWEDVDRLLSRLAGKNIDPAMLAEMSRQIGPALFLRMKQNPAIGDTARAGIDKLTKASLSEAESPEALRRAIDQLDDNSIDTRLAATRTLLSGGNAAITELVAAAVSETPAAPRDDILRAMLQLGPTSVSALRQLALYGTPAVRQRALQSLARINRQTHLTDLLTAMFASDATAEEVAIAKSQLQRIEAGLPSRSEAIEILEIVFRDQQDTALRTDNDDQTVTLWSVDKDGTGVTAQTTSAMMAAYRDVADAAARLRRVGGLSAETEGEVLAADMAYRVLIDPDWGDADQVAAIHQSYGGLRSGSAISAAIGRSLANRDEAATLGLIRLIDPTDASVLVRHRLLDGNGAVPTPLVQAASDSSPRVRYEAALLASQMAQGAAYPGSSQVRKCLREMVSLTDQPTAILVETRSDVIIQLERILSDSGLLVDVVGSVSEVQRSVDRLGDLRMILAKTELPDLPPIEMVDLVRRTDRGRDVPIVFYGSEPVGLEEKRWQAPLVWIDRPASTSGLAEVLDNVRRRRRLPPLSVIDRQSLRAAAAAQLGELAQAG